MRILFVGLVVAVSIFALTLTYYSLAPLHYGFMDKFDSEWENKTGVGKTVQQSISATMRYAYWVSYYVIVFGLIAWLFMASQRRDPESYGVYGY